MLPILFPTLFMLVCVGECGRREILFIRIHSQDHVTNTEVTGWYNSQAVEDFSGCARACSDDTSCVSFSYSPGVRTCFRFSQLLHLDNVDTVSPEVASFGKKGFCPAGYTGVDDVCLRVFTPSVTATVAEARCQKDGARLLSLQTPEKLDAVITFMNQTGCDLGTRRWLSGSDAKVEGQWSWIDGSGLESTSGLWCPGEPNDSNGNENCLQLHRVSTCFNDYPCSIEIPYICEINQFLL